MWIAPLSLLFGFFLGWKEFLPEKYRRLTSQVTLVSLLLLLFLMGNAIGSNPDVMADLPRIGARALILSLFAVAGSVLFAWLAFGKTRSNGSFQGEPRDKSSGRSLTWIIILDVGLGILVGYLFMPDGLRRYLDTLSSLVLGLLLAGIGLDLGHEKSVWQNLKATGWKVLFVPLCVALGTLSGSLLAGILVGLRPFESLSVGSGFGWYSLSGILLTRLKGPGLGALSFLSNVLREIVAVISIAPCARYLGNIVAVAPGGATSMDTTLPVVAAAAGPDTSVISVISGMVLSMLVPILVPLFAKL